MTQVPNMTLDDLKTGMIITVRNGYKYMVLTNYDERIATKCSFIAIRKYGWIDSVGFTIDLKYPKDHGFDIVKVSYYDNCSRLLNFEDNEKSWVTIWEETPAVKLTVAEIEARLGYKVEIMSDDNKED